MIVVAALAGVLLGALVTGAVVAWWLMGGDWWA